jgi:hypothetical protein
VKARFKGRLEQQNLQPPQRYTLSFEGDGGVAGFARGSAEVELSEAEGSSTRLTYRARAQIGGRLAQIGSRLVDATAARMSAQFFERLTQAIAAPAVAQHASQLPLPMPTSFGEPPSLPAPAGASDARPAATAWDGAVSVSMPAWAWSFTVAVAALLAAWISTH